MRPAVVRSALRSLPRPQASRARNTIPTPPRSSAFVATRSSPRSYSTASPDPTPSSDTAPPPPESPESTGDASTKLSESQTKQAEAEKKAEELQARLDELKKDNLYRQAEIQTLTRRIAEEKSKATEFAITSFARSLLGTSDVLTTALSHVPQPIQESNQSLADLFNGVTMTQRAMHKTFEENGMKKMDVSRGTAFDPNLHEATFHIPVEVAPPREDGKTWGKGEVVEVSKEGWTIGNRVLRPAQVGVTQLE